MYISFNVHEVAGYLMEVFERDAAPVLPKLVKAGFLPPEDEERWREMRERYRRQSKSEYTKVQVGYPPMAAFDLHWLFTRLDTFAVVCRRQRFAPAEKGAAIWNSNSKNPRDYFDYRPLDSDKWKPRPNSLPEQYFDPNYTPPSLDELAEQSEL